MYFNFKPWLDLIGKRSAPIFLVGKHEDNPWQMRGLFEDLEEAADCAREHDYFVLRIPKNQLFDDDKQWLAWRPNQEDDPPW